MSQKLISLFHAYFLTPGFSLLSLPPWSFSIFPLLFYFCMNLTSHFPHSRSLAVVLEHAAGIWWMITCHSLFIIIQTINYTSLMLVVPLEIDMLGTDQCENGISFAKCLSMGTAWWLQSGCFNSCGTADSVITYCLPQVTLLQGIISCVRQPTAFRRQRCSCSPSAQGGRAK